ncbi:hypothetical protein JCM6882_007920 [Rhodosporidiobolus microsporus]
MRPKSTAAILGTTKEETRVALDLVLKYHAAPKPLDDATHAAWEGDAQPYKFGVGPGNGRWQDLFDSAAKTAPTAPIPTTDALPPDIRSLVDQASPANEDDRRSRVDQFLVDRPKWWNANGAANGGNNIFKGDGVDSSASEIDDEDNEERQDGSPAGGPSDPSSGTVDASSRPGKGKGRERDAPAQDRDVGDDLLDTISSLGNREAAAAKSAKSAGASSAKRPGTAKKHSATGSRRSSRLPSPRLPFGYDDGGDNPSDSDAGAGGRKSGGGGGGGGGGDDGGGDGGGDSASRDLPERRSSRRKRRHGRYNESSSSGDNDLDDVRGTRASAEDKSSFFKDLGAYLDKQDRPDDPYLAKTASISHTARQQGRKAIERSLKASSLRLPVEVAYAVIVNDLWDLPKVNGFVGRTTTDSEATLREGDDGKFKIEPTSTAKPKELSTPFEWERAFSICEELATSIYAHRREEFRIYREHLRQIMADEPDIFQLWIAYDLRFRSTLGQPGRATRLSDVVTDTYLRHAVVFSSPAYFDSKHGARGGGKASGGGSGGAKGGGSSGEGRKAKKAKKDGGSERCNNWNGRVGACKEDGPFTAGATTTRGNSPPAHPAPTDDLTPESLISARLYAQSTLTDAALDDAVPINDSPTSLPGLDEQPRLTRFLSYPLDDPPITHSLAALAHVRFPTSPPPSVLADPVTNDLLKSHPHLFDFEINQPYDLAALEDALTCGPTRYPHQGLVKDFLYNMRHGWWPLHDGDFVRAESSEYPMSPEDWRLVEEKGQEGFEEGRMGPAFPSLLPGMTSSPTFVRRPVGGKPRWIIDHARSGLNDGIGPDDARPKYDMVEDLVRLMRHLLSLPRDERLPKLKLMLWRADIKNAYWGLPMHPYWQPRQALKFKNDDTDGYYRIDYRMEFGSRASPYLWSVAQSFMLWIAQESSSIEHPFAFVDDTFGADPSGQIMIKVVNKVKYHPPKQLFEMLGVFDRIKAPYDIIKQLASVDVATGTLVDWLKVLGLVLRVAKEPKDCTIEVPVDQKRQFALLSAEFSKGHKVTIAAWRTWLGRAQFVGLVSPWARWALNRLYVDLAKAEKDLGAGSTKKIRVKEEQARVVDWYLEQVLHAPPLSIFDATLLCWPIAEMDVTVWSDSCGAASTGGGGMGFVVSVKDWGNGSDLGYYYRHDTPFKDNNFAEGVALLEGFRTAVSLAPNARRFLLFTDSSTVIYAADAGRGTDKMLELAYRFFTTSQAARVDYRVRHVAGKKNGRADGLSRSPIVQLRAEWGINLRNFQPSVELIGGLSQ